MKEEIKIGMILRNIHGVVGIQDAIAIVVEKQDYGFWVIRHLSDGHQHRSHERQLRRFWQVIA